MAAKKEIKSERLGVRISPKLRYGLNLMARKYRVSESEMISRCVESALATEGLEVRKPGELFSLLDKLWSESECERVLALTKIAPEYASLEDMRTASLIGEYQKEFESVSKYLGKPAIRCSAVDSRLSQLRECDEIDVGVLMFQIMWESNQEFKNRFKTVRDFMDWVCDDLNGKKTK